MSEAEQEKDRKRSPNYPSISLQTAVAKIAKLYKEDKGTAGTPEVLAAHWDTTVKSSSFLQTVASLKKYGLIFELDGAPTAKLKLTKTALDIVMLPGDDPKHEEALKRAALTPKLFKKLWDDHGLNLPSDENLTHELVTSQGFLADAAADAIKQYRRNLAFAKLGNYDKIPDNGQQKPIKIGDFIQWRSQNVDQFKEPQKVAGKSEDGEYLFVHGAPCGIPVEQAIRMDVPDAKLGGVMQEVKDFLNGKEVRKAPPNPFFDVAPPAGMRRYKYTVDTGDAVLEWPESLSDEDYQGISVWLESMKPKIKRSVKTDKAGEPRKPKQDDQD